MDRAQLQRNREVQKIGDRVIMKIRGASKRINSKKYGRGVRGVSLKAASEGGASHGTMKKLKKRCARLKFPVAKAKFRKLYAEDAWPWVDFLNHVCREHGYPKLFE